MSTTSDQLFAIAILIDELKHDEISHRLGSMQHLKEIADALGPERTRNELLPFLLDSSLDDDDEVLLEMAQQLGSFTKQVGGPNFAHVLIPALEALSNVEEPAVREKSVLGLISISKEMTDAQVLDTFFPLIKNLAQKDWFTSRITAASLMSTLFSRTNPKAHAIQRSEMVKLFVELGKDDTPMVRKQLACAMPNFVQECCSEENQDVLLELFTQLSRDDHDTVRLYACEIGIALMMNKKSAAASQNVVPALSLELAGDRGWRVRWSVAQVFDKLIQACGATSQFVDAFLQLLRDVEPEVRTAATGQLTKVAKSLPQAATMVIPTFLQVLTELAQDPSEHVREALGLVILGLAPVVGKAETIKSLLPVFLSLLKDPNAKVRLSMVSELGSLENVIGIDQLSSALLPAVIDLAKDKNWRVREQTISHLPVLAKQMDLAFFETNFFDLLLGFLYDRVYSIREAASAKLLLEITQVFGKEWTTSKVVPKILELKSHNNYLYRITSVRCVEVLIPILDKDFALTTLIPFLLSLAQDRVPNVRFAVCKALERSKIEDDKGSAKQLLVKLAAEDKDGDVVFFAKKALAVV